MIREDNVVLALPLVDVQVRLEPAHNVLASMLALATLDTFSGLAPWVQQTAAQFSKKAMTLHLALFRLLPAAFQPTDSDIEFPAHLERLAAEDPNNLITRLLADYRRYTGPGAPPGSDLAAYLEFARTTQINNEPVSPAVYAQVRALVKDPPRFQATLVKHLRAVWEGGLKAEWERSRPLLERTVEAFAAHNYSGLTPHEAIRAVTGRDLHLDVWLEKLSQVQQIIFVPSLHIGPYLFSLAEGPLVRIVFGARPPESPAPALPELNRAQLLTWLGALADDTRLNILQLVGEAGELCAQDIITLLNLGQSSASRHLSHLSATGFLIEHYPGGKTKCYRLNPARFHQVSQGVARLAHPAA